MVVVVAVVAVVAVVVVGSDSDSSSSNNKGLGKDMGDPERESGELAWVQGGHVLRRHIP